MVNERELCIEEKLALIKTKCQEQCIRSLKALNFEYCAVINLKMKNCNPVHALTFSRREGVNTMVHETIIQNVLSNTNKF